MQFFAIFLSLFPARFPRSPSETPDGASVGLVKNMALMCGVTIASNSNNVRAIIRDLGVIDFDGSNFDAFHKCTWVIVNGDIVGVAPDPRRVYFALLDMKRRAVISVQTAVCWDHVRREIRVSTESGRCVRPMYIVKHGNQLALTRKHIVQLWNDKISWLNLISGSYEHHLEPALEFIDVEEMDHLMLAMKYEDLLDTSKRAPNMQPVARTHLEIHPSLMFGVLTSAIPLSDHNQAPRNTYQVSQLFQGFQLLSAMQPISVY